MSSRKRPELPNVLVVSSNCPNRRKNISECKRIQLLSKLNFLLTNHHMANSSYRKKHHLVDVILCDEVLDNYLTRHLKVNLPDITERTNFKRTKSSSTIYDVEVESKNNKIINKRSRHVKIDDNYNIGKGNFMSRRPTGFDFTDTADSRQTWLSSDNGIANVENRISTLQPPTGGGKVHVEIQDLLQFKPKRRKFESTTRPVIGLTKREYKEKTLIRPDLPKVVERTSFESSSLSSCGSSCHVEKRTTHYSIEDGRPKVQRYLLESKPSEKSICGKREVKNFASQISQSYNHKDQLNKRRTVAKIQGADEGKRRDYALKEQPPKMLKQTSIESHSTLSSHGGMVKLRTSLSMSSDNESRLRRRKKSGQNVKVTKKEKALNREHSQGMSELLSSHSLSDYVKEKNPRQYSDTKKELHKTHKRHSLESRSKCEVTKVRKSQSLPSYDTRVSTVQSIIKNDQPSCSERLKGLGVNKKVHKYTSIHRPIYGDQDDLTEGCHSGPSSETRIITERLVRREDQAPLSRRHNEYGKTIEIPFKHHKYTSVSRPHSEITQEEYILSESQLIPTSQTRITTAKVIRAPISNKSTVKIRKYDDLGFEAVEKYGTADEKPLKNHKYTSISRPYSAVRQEEFVVKGAISTPSSETRITTEKFTRIDDRKPSSKMTSLDLREYDDSGMITFERYNKTDDDHYNKQSKYHKHSTPSRPVNVTTMRYEERDSKSTPSSETRFRTERLFARDERPVISTRSNLNVREYEVSRPYSTITREYRETTDPTLPSFDTRITTESAITHLPSVTRTSNLRMHGTTDISRCIMKNRTCSAVSKPYSAVTREYDGGENQSIPSSETIVINETSIAKNKGPEITKVTMRKYDEPGFISQYESEARNIYNKPYYSKATSISRPYSAVNGEFWRHRTDPSLPSFDTRITTESSMTRHNLQRTGNLSYRVQGNSEVATIGACNLSEFNEYTPYSEVRREFDIMENQSIPSSETVVMTETSVTKKNRPDISKSTKVSMRNYDEPGFISQYEVEELEQKHYPSMSRPYSSVGEKYSGREALSTPSSETRIFTEYNTAGKHSRMTSNLQNYTTVSRPISAVTREYESRQTLPSYETRITSEMSKTSDYVPKVQRVINVTEKECAFGSDHLVEKGSYSTVPTRHYSAVTREYELPSFNSKVKSETEETALTPTNMNIKVYKDSHAIYRNTKNTRPDNRREHCSQATKPNNITIKVYEDSVPNPLAKYDVDGMNVYENYSIATRRPYSVAGGKSLPSYDTRITTERSTTTRGESMPRTQPSNFSIKVYDDLDAERQKGREVDKQSLRCSLVCRTHGGKCYPLPLTRTTKKRSLRKDNRSLLHKPSNVSIKVYEDLDAERLERHYAAKRRVHGQHEPDLESISQHSLSISISHHSSLGSVENKVSYENYVKSTNHIAGTNQKSTSRYTCCPELTTRTRKSFSCQKGKTIKSTRSNEIDVCCTDLNTSKWLTSLPTSRSMDDIRTMPRQSICQYDLVVRNSLSNSTGELSVESSSKYRFTGKFGDENYEKSSKPQSKVYLSVSSSSRDAEDHARVFDQTGCDAENYTFDTDYATFNMTMRDPTIQMEKIDYSLGDGEIQREYSDEGSYPKAKKRKLSLLDDKCGTLRKGISNIERCSSDTFACSFLSMDRSHRPCGSPNKIDKSYMLQSHIDIIPKKYNMQDSRQQILLNRTQPKAAKSIDYISEFLDDSKRISCESGHLKRRHSLDSKLMENYKLRRQILNEEAYPKYGRSIIDRTKMIAPKNRMSTSDHNFYVTSIHRESHSSDSKSCKTLSSLRISSLSSDKGLSRISHQLTTRPERSSDSSLISTSHSLLHQHGRGSRITAVSSRNTRLDPSMSGRLSESIRRNSTDSSISISHSISYENIHRSEGDPRKSHRITTFTHQKSSNSSLSSQDSNPTKEMRFRVDAESSRHTGFVPSSRMSGQISECIRRESSESSLTSITHSFSHNPRLANGLGSRMTAISSKNTGLTKRTSGRLSNSVRRKSTDSSSVTISNSHKRSLVQTQPQFRLKSHGSVKSNRNTFRAESIRKSHQENNRMSSSDSKVSNHSYSSVIRRQTVPSCDTRKESRISSRTESSGVSGRISDFRYHRSTNPNLLRINDRNKHSRTNILHIKSATDPRLCRMSCTSSDSFRHQRSSSAPGASVTFEHKSKSRRSKSDNQISTRDSLPKGKSYTQISVENVKLIPKSIRRADSSREKYRFENISTLNEHVSLNQKRANLKLPEISMEYRNRFKIVQDRSRLTSYAEKDMKRLIIANDRQESFKRDSYDGDFTIRKYLFESAPQKGQARDVIPPNFDIYSNMRQNERESKFSECEARAREFSFQSRSNCPQTTYCKEFNDKMRQLKLLAQGNYKRYRDENNNFRETNSNLYHQICSLCQDLCDACQLRVCDAVNNYFDNFIERDEGDARGR